MRCTFLIYEKDGEPGNDLTNKNPYDWLNQVRLDYPESTIVITGWQLADIRESDFPSIQSKIGIEYDEVKRAEAQARLDKEFGSTEIYEALPDIPDDVPEIPDTVVGEVVKPKGWALRKEYVDAEGNVYHKGVLQPKE